MINSRITGDDKRHASVGARELTPNGVVTYNRPLVSRTPIRAFLTDETGNPEFTQDNVALADPTRIYDGGDTALFTANALSGAGRWDTTSTAQAYVGSQSLSGASARNNDTMSLSSGTDYQANQFSALDMYIYLTQWPTSGSVKEIELELWSNGTLASDTIKVGAYIDKTLFNAWQLCTIPFADFNVTTTTWDEVRIRFRDTGQGQAPRAYFDEIVMQGLAAGGTIDFVYAPSADQRVEVRKLVLAGANNSDKVKYDELFGAPKLANGLLVTLRSGGKIIDSQVIRDNFRLVQLANTTIAANKETVSSTTMYRSDTEFAEESLILNGRTNDEIRITVRDDLSSLLSFTSSVEAYELFTDFE